MAKRKTTIDPTVTIERGTLLPQEEAMALVEELLEAENTVEEGLSRKGWADIIQQALPLIKAVQEWDEITVPWDVTDPESVKVRVKAAMVIAAVLAKMTEGKWDDEAVVGAELLLTNDAFLGVFVRIASALFRSRSVVEGRDGCPCVTEASLGAVCQGDDRARLKDRGITTSALCQVSDGTLAVLGALLA